MQTNERSITFVEAIREATEQALEKHPEAFLIGEGVPDPKEIFGTTKGLREKFGPNKVFDMPVSENGMTGICIGAALQGLKPILVHQRIDFSLYSADQLINNAAKWFSMFGGQKSVPLTIRAIIGRGWGQGNQHSQNLSVLYAHVPGLKVVMPSTAHTAKGLFLAAVQDPNPVLFVEHRWCHHTSSKVPSEHYTLPIGKARVVSSGSDITIVAWSYMFIEALKAAEVLGSQGVSIDLIDAMTVSPLDIETIKKSVKKTGRLLVLEEAWRFGGISGEIIASISEDPEIKMKSVPVRLNSPDFPCPSTPSLAKHYYVTTPKIVRTVSSMLGINFDHEPFEKAEREKLADVPDHSFKGPF